jgi:hypothetical protein
MKFRFRAKIYKVGINPCVKVPLRISDKMEPVKGYIPIKGKIDKYSFQQTLVPVKNEGYRLYVNGLMLKGGGVSLGDTVDFIIEQDFTPREDAYPMPKELRKALSEHKLLKSFKALTPSRQKEILRYLSFLKTKESLLRNIDKVIDQLKGL